MALRPARRADNRGVQVPPCEDVACLGGPDEGTWELIHMCLEEGLSPTRSRQVVGFAEAV